ncbi:MAG: cytochrome c oxidase accessory protein CcoG [Verrucomicrobiota bacterium JB022]|nr:cytochrome c oxidase accessory protein CcoG [Verrucomicrobiota bacterium JB022]
MSSTSPKAPNLNTVTTINRDGSRFIIHPSDVKGRFTAWRRIVAVLLIVVYIALPWIPINGHPAVFLDVARQRFHLFGLTFAAQDMWMLFFGITGLAFLLFFVTALFGRVWCGWACPQTVFLEHVFRRIERWIEGDAATRKKLDRASWTPDKAIKRVAKHTIFVLLAAVIAHIFLSYFVSIPGLWGMLIDSPLQHWSAFLFVAASTALIYGNFAWFREQLCIIICPYGRFQSALIDNHTYNVAYDYNRGNPPGKPRDPNAGDCIDCRRCVQVCPTGIDIRQGLQLECIGCAGCIDACDTVMDKLNRPRGLIRYATDEQLEGRKSKLVRARTLLYMVFGLIGLCVAAFSFNSYEPLSANVVRMRGSPFYVDGAGVRNQYQVRLVNKSERPMEVWAVASAGDQALELRGLTERIRLQPMQEATATAVVLVPRDTYSGNFRFRLELYTDEGATVSREIEFVGPDPALLEPR